MKNKKIKIITATLLALAIIAALFVACSSDDLVTVKFYVDGELYRTCRAEKGKGIDDVPEVPYKEGYKGRWDRTDFDEITESITVTAIYEKDTYTVSFYADGVLVAAITEKKGKTITGIPSVPAKDGYDGEWNVTIFNGLTADTVVTAVYTPKAAFATFYRAGKTYEPASVAAGDKPAAGTYYEKYGDTFVLTSDSTFEEGKTYYVAKREVYTRVEIKNGALSYVPELPATDNRSVKWMQLKRTENGESFVGFDADGLENGAEIVAYEYVTVTLVDEFGGESVSGKAEYDVGESVAGISSVVEERTDYGFYGWYFDSSLRSEAVFPRTFENNVTLYAKWLGTKRTEGLAFEYGAVVGYSGTETEVFIPYKYTDDGGASVIVTGIKESAFSGNSSVTAVHLPATVKTLGNNAFINCSSLVEVFYDDGCFIESVGESAFEGCVSLVRTEVCENTAVIGTRAFYGCVSLAGIDGIGSSVISEVPDYAFYRCESLGNAVLPETTERIGDFAFEYASQARITFKNADNLRSIGKFAFAYCGEFGGVSAKNLEFIGEKAYLGSANVSEATFIAGGATHELFGSEAEIAEGTGYYYASAGGARYAIPGFLYSVTFAKGNGVIAENALVGLYTVKRIRIEEGVKAIEDRAFATDSEVDASGGELVAEFPSTLEEIGAEAFVGRGDLKSVAFPSSLKTIGDKAFYGINGLTNVVLPARNSLTSVGREAFAGTDWYEDYDGLIILGKTVVGISETYCRNRGYTVITAEEMGACDKIAPYAFYGNETLTEIRLGEMILTVGEYAFAECSSLEVFAFNANTGSVTQREIGQCVLEGADALADLTLYEDVATDTLFGGNAPASLEILRIEFAGKNNVLGADAFSAYNGIKELYVGDGFVTVGSGAFADCAALKKAVIGKDVKVIGQGAFGNLSELEIVDLSANAALEEIGENAFAGTKTGNVVFPATLRVIDAGAFCGARLTSAVFGDALEKIGARAFEGNSLLKTAVLQEGVTEIGDYAFSGCDLESFVMPSTVSAENIGRGVLYGNSGFMSLTTAQSLSVPDMFTYGEGNTAVTEIPVNFLSVRITGGEIGEKQYYGITSVQTVAISKGVTAIGASAFEGCSGIRSITIPSSVGEIGARAFADCVSLASCQIDAVASELVFVDKEVFAGDVSLGYAVFPSGTASGDWTGMFDGCVSLTTTNLPSAITEIGDYAYRNCASLVALGMHDGVTSIGAYAFENCDVIDFDDVRFDELLSIGKGAFAGCDALHGIKAENATSIGQGAYEGSGALEEITVNGEKADYYTDMKANIITVNVVGNPAADAFDGCDGLETVVFYGGSAETVRAAVNGLDLDRVTVYVSGEIFDALSDLRVHVNPTDESNFVFACDAVTGTAVITGTAENAVFDGAAYLPGETVYEGVKYAVTAIGAGAFTANAELTSIVIPSSVTEIGAGAFSGCVNLADVRFERGSRLAIIREAAFDGCVNLRKTAFPSSLVTIGNNAFHGCAALTEIRFFANSKLEEIGSYAFNGASSLTKAEITGPIAKIGSNAFNGCTAMTEFSFGKKATITEIPNSMFNGCNSLAAITIPNSVRIIGTNAFKNCSSLSAITLPDGVTSLGAGAFASSGLTEITMSANLTDIGASAFESCEKLIAVNIPDKVTVLGEAAFRGCFRMEEIRVGKGVKTIGKYAFYGTSALQTIVYRAVSASDLSEDAKAFYNAGQNTGAGVIIGKEVQRIPANLFSSEGTADGAPAIGSVVFEETSSCAEIGENAFAFLTRINDMVLPVSVMAIGGRAFNGSTSLRLSLEAAREPAGFVSGWKDGMSFAPTFGKNNFIEGDYAYVVHENKAYLTIYSGTGIAPAIPATIGGYPIASLGAAFENNVSVKEIVVPDGVSGLGSFYGCSALENVVIGNAVTRIPDRAFYGCIALDNLVIPVAVKEIGKEAFYGCEGLETVYFDGKSAAELLATEEECGYITAYAVSLYVSQDAPVTSVDETVYTLLPETKDGYSVYTRLYWSVGDDAFAYLIKEGGENEYSITVDGTGNMKDYAALALVPWNRYASSIVRLVVRSGVGALGRNAFASLVSLKEVYYNAAEARYIDNKKLFDGSGAESGITLRIGADVKEIPSHLFRENARLKEIIYEDGALGAIGDYAFYGCVYLETVSVPDTVTVIGAHAFENCTGITEITVGLGVTTIGQKAFYGADNLSVVNYNAKNAEDAEGNASVFDSAYKAVENGGGFVVNVGTAVTRIPSYAFYDCGNLIGLVIPNKGALTEIGKEAFYKCEALVSVTLPSTLATVSERAFAEATSLSGITFGTGTSALTVIGKEAFLNTAFYSDDANWTTQSDGITRGVLYLAGKYLIKAVSGLSGEYTVSGATAVIADNAFEDCNALEYIRIPTAVEYIGENAFAGCARLKTVYVASYAAAAGFAEVGSFGGILTNAIHVYIAKTLVTDRNVRIGQYLKSGYALIDGEIVFGSGSYYAYTKAAWDTGDTQAYLINDENNPGYYEINVKGAGRMADYSKDNLMPWRDYLALISRINVNAGVTKVGDSAFFGCSEATSVVMGNTVEEIGEAAFEGCASLVTLEIPENVTVIGNGAFADCLGLKTVRYLAKKAENPGENNGIFANVGTEANGGTEVKIDRGVQYIPAYLFYPYTSGEKTPAISSVEFLSANNINDCVEIGSYAFAYLRGLQNVKFAKGATLKQIDEGAFVGCEAIGTVEITAGIEYIGKSAFAFCGSLSQLVFSAVNFTDGEKGNAAFEGAGAATGLTVTVSNKSKTLPSYLFENANYLTALAFEDGGICEKIGQSAFSGCVSLTTITIPDYVKEIGEGAFAGCSSATKYTAPFVGGKAEAVTGDATTLFGYVFGTEEKEGTTAALQTHGAGSVTYYIPDSIVSVEITVYTNMYFGSFGNCSKIKSIKLNGNSEVDTVYKYGINESGQQYIVEAIGNGSVVGNEAFFGCTSLTSVTLTSRTASIGSAAFKDCSSLGEITVSENVTSIGENAFENCSSLTKIYFNATNCADMFTVDGQLRSINVFANAGTDKSGIEVLFGSNVERVPAYAFAVTGKVSPKLAAVAFEDGAKCKEIGEKAFYGAGEKTLTSISLVNTVKSVGESAFEGTAYYLDATKWQGGVLYIDSCLVKANLANNTGIAEYNVMSGTIVIADKAFYGCKYLAAVNLPASVGYIGQYAFAGCTGLKELHTEKSAALTAIGSYAFSGCLLLGTEKNDAGEEVGFYIRANVSQIDAYAFYGCTGLTKIYIESAFVAGGMVNNSYDAYGGVLMSADTVYIAENITGTGSYIINNYETTGSVTGGYRKYTKR
ncbi:MAG: leucine-rich repeat domain-containing protein [Christensenellales bacterium]